MLKYSSSAVAKSQVFEKYIGIISLFSKWMFTSTSDFVSLFGVQANVMVKFSGTLETIPPWDNGPVTA